MKRKLQTIKFESVEDFLAYLPEEEKILVEQLRKLVYDCIPDCKEKLSYNVPYYSRKSSFCFIWPSSILWGKKKTYEGVRFGFTKGYLLTDESSYLEKGNRKQVYWKDFKALTNEDLLQLKYFIYESISLEK